MARKQHPDARLTLREAFAKHYHTADMTRLSRKKFEHTFKSWERHTDNPAVGDLTAEHAEQYRAACLAAGQKPITINRRWNDIRAVLRRLAPPVMGNPAGLSIIEGVVYVKPLRMVLPTPRRVALEDLTRFYVACKHAQYPRVGVPPADWWRALIVMAFFTGLRKSDLLALTFDQIDAKGLTIRFNAQKTQKSDIFPLHPIALTHLERIWRPGGERIFRGCYRVGGFIYRQWKRIDAHAKIAEPFRLHDIRRTGACEVERVRHGMGKAYLQHVSRSVTDVFYLNMIEELGETIRAMRVPPGWGPGPKMSARAEEKQRLDRALIRADEFHVPFGANPSEWAFSKFGFRFRGSRWFRMEGQKLRLLRALVESPEPLDVKSLREVVGKLRNAEAVHPRMADLRRRLRVCLGLEPGWNPLPCVARGEGGVWTLHIPPNVKPPEIAAPAPPRALGAAAPPAAELRVFAWLTPSMIRHARLRHGLRQIDLAERLGVADATIRRWERGHPMFVQHASKLCEVLGIEEPRDDAA